MYIVTSEPKDNYNIKNEFIGVTPKRALFYLKSIGKHRIYRDYFDVQDKDKVMFRFKTEEEALDLCNEINSVYNDTFNVEKIN